MGKIDFESALNGEQLPAVTHGDGPQLVLAGAGSGKTRVITYRVAWLVQELGIDPAQIAAVTFTNKAAGEMKHGPIALIDEDLPVVAVATGDRVAEKVRSNMEQVKARDGVVIALTDRDPRELARVADEVLEVPRIAPLLQPIVNAIPLQLLAYHVGVRRGCDVDQPRNLAKSVTVE